MIAAAFLFFLHHKLAVGVVVAVLANAVSFGSGYWKGYASAARNAEIKTIEKVVTIREKQNEIRNHRPDELQLIDSLRNGRF